MTSKSALRLLLPAVLTGLLALAPLAQAATADASINGTIKAFDLKAMTLTLDSGTVYHLPYGFKDPGLKVGEKVAVAWKMMGADHEASTVTIVK